MRRLFAVSSILLLGAVITACAFPFSFWKQAQIAAAAGCDFVSDTLHWWDGETDGSDLVGAADDTSFTTVAAGKVNNALSYDGTVLLAFGSDKLTNLAAASAWTVEGWINLTDFVGATGGERKIVGFKGNVANPSISIAVETGGGTLAIQWYAGGASFPTMNGGVISFLTWYHFALTHDGTTARLYVDGTEADTEVAGTALAFDTFNQCIGGNDGSPARLWKGLIDELTIYDRALTSNEVVCIYNAGTTGKVRP